MGAHVGEGAEVGKKMCLSDRGKPLNPGCAEGLAAV